MEPNGILHLDFKKNSSGKTYVAKQFFKLPLQVLPTNTMEDGEAFLYILNPSSGMLEGDLFDLRFSLTDGAEAVITTPSSNKIYRSKGGPACQRVAIDVAEGCIAEYLPEHSVPYANSRFLQKNIYRVQSGGFLFSWDTMVPGRMSRDECFDFAYYMSDTEIYYGEKLVLKDRLKIVPGDESYKGIACLGDYSIFQTAYVVGQNITEELSEELYQYFMDKKDVFRGAASAADKNLMVIKALFKTTLGMRDIQRDIWDIVRRNTLGKPSFRIRKY